MTFEPNEKIDFSYPEGFQKAVDSLDFLPEEQREAMIKTLLSFMPQL